MFGLSGGRGDGYFFGANQGVDCGGFANIGVPDEANLGSAGVGWICGFGVICGMLGYRGN